MRVAELTWLAEKTGHPRKFYVGRGLLGVFLAAGLSGCSVSTRSSDRLAPLDPPSRAFLSAYLGDLRTPRLRPASIANSWNASTASSIPAPTSRSSIGPTW